MKKGGAFFLICLGMLFVWPLPPAFSTPAECPTARARRAIEAYLGAPAGERLETDTSPSRPVFVTLARGGRTRGCAGTFQPLFPTLAEEIAYFAVQAATRDFRYPALNADDLEEITVMVTFPGPPQAVSSLSGYDPRLHGLMAAGDGRRGVVLAREAKTVAYAVSRALADAGIEDEEGVEYYLFECLTIIEEESR